MKKPLMILFICIVIAVLIAAPYVLAESIVADSAPINWMELLSVALYTVVSVTIPIVARYVVAFLRSKCKEHTEKLKNEELKQGIRDATDAVLTAVTATSQTYVDNLKEDGMFDEVAQREALHQALGMARKLLTDAARTALDTLYGGADDWLVAKIEQSVRETKNGSVLSGEPF